MLFRELPADVTWFELNPEKDDVYSVLDFTRRLPGNLQIIFQDNSFLSFLNRTGRFNNVNENLFFAAFEESRRMLINNLDEIEISIRENKERLYDFRIALGSVGFTENSLKLKAATLDILWNNVIEVKRRKKRFNLIDWFITSVKNPIVKAMRKLLQLLNDLMDNLKIVIPGLESLKEWKDVGESYVSLADEA